MFLIKMFGKFSDIMKKIWYFMFGPACVGLCVTNGVLRTTMGSIWTTCRILQGATTIFGISNQTASLSIQTLILRIGALFLPTNLHSRSSFLLIENAIFISDSYFF
jgi:hypothetical protein